ncbi:MAG: hypothetical protein SVR08_11005 [Spirochaetota bacterium]|nr:hypothetical protein [Spirochaetota bacterium]
MERQTSFINLGKKYMHTMRKKINISEDKIDLGNHFSHIVTNMLNKVFYEKELNIDQDDIAFNPKAENHFTLSSKLLNSEIFIKSWNNSDLPSLVTKFANSTYSRYIHLNKHQEKTEQKIRN